MTPSESCITSFDSGPRGRILALDFLRLGAALIVVIEHFFLAYDIPMPAVFTSGFMYGKACVTLFFVLSGYMLAQSVFSDGSSVKSYAAFGVRRIFRIYPVYWCALALAFLILLDLKSTPGFTNPVIDGGAAGATFLEREGLQLRQWLLQAALVIPGLEIQFAIPTVWTLVIEAYVSIIFPLLAWCILQKRVALFVLPVLIFGSGWLAEYLIGSAGFIGLFGIGIAMHHIPVRLGKCLPPWAWLTLLAVSLGLYYCMSLKDSGWGVFTKLYLCGMGCAGIIWITVHWPPLRSALDAIQKRLRYDLSYGIYILHLPIMMFLRKPWIAKELQVPAWGLFILSLITIVLVALVLHLLVEAPAIRFGKKISRWIQA